MFCNLLCTNLVPDWIGDPEMSELVDELFVEVHYHHPSMAGFWWDQFNHTREEALQLFVDLRTAGFVAHPWPWGGRKNCRKGIVEFDRRKCVQSDELVGGRAFGWEEEWIHGVIGCGVGSLMLNLVYRTRCLRRGLIEQRCINTMKSFIKAEWHSEEVSSDSACCGPSQDDIRNLCIFKNEVRQRFFSKIGT